MTIEITVARVAAVNAMITEICAPYRQREKAHVAAEIVGSERIGP